MKPNTITTNQEGFRNRNDVVEARQRRLAEMSGPELLQHIQNLAAEAQRLEALSLQALSFNSLVNSQLSTLNR